MNGTLPPQWKHADIKLVLKPGKPLTIKDHHPFLSRKWANFLNTTRSSFAPSIEDYYFPATTYESQPLLSTQDIALQLKVDISKAFHDIPHYLALKISTV